MTHVEKFLKRFGPIEELQRLVDNAFNLKKINEIDCKIAMKKYDEEYQNAVLLDKNIITIQELRKRKEKKDREEIIKRLLIQAGKLDW
mgnify:CR=1 FL=1